MSVWAFDLRSREDIEQALAERDIAYDPTARTASGTEPSGCLMRSWRGKGWRYPCSRATPNDLSGKPRFVGFADNQPPKRYGCPFCGKTLRDLERVEARHTPATVPEHVTGYAVTRRYVVVECENGHRMERMGDTIVGSRRTHTVWHH